MQPLKFTNPANGYTVEITRSAPVWTLLFGAVYLAYKGLWNHVFVLACIILLSFFIPDPYGIAMVLVANIAYASWVTDLLAAHYGKKGWIKVNDHGQKSPTGPQTDREATPAATRPTVDSTGISAPSIADELTKLAKLKDSKAITEDEFSTLKSKLLNS